MNSITYKENSTELFDKRGFAVLKSNTVQIVLFVFLATFFYSKSEEYRMFRIIYSVFLYLSLWKLLVFYNSTPTLDVKIPSFYKLYLGVLFIFVAYNFIVDLNHPGFNLLTQINNPYGFLACLTILAFGLGSTTLHLEGVFKILIFISIIFIIFCFVPDLPKFEGFHGYISSYAVIPFFILSHHFKKYRWYSYVLIGLACMFSVTSDYRIIMLRILMFLSLFYSLTLFKRQNIAKFLILFISCLCVYHFIANLRDILIFFGNYIKVQSFETDTRSFLYEELLGDLEGYEILLGRGFSGTYFSFFFLHTWETFGVSFDRFTLEVGFLQLMLKGGFVYYILFITPLLVTGLKGILNKNTDSLSFSICIFIFAELLLMFFENIPNYGFNFFNLFFLAGFAYRNMANNNNSNYPYQA